MEWIQSVKEAGPLIPFTMTQTGGKKELNRFMADTFEEGVQQAEQFLASMSPMPYFALIAYDGFVTIEDKKYDAILVRAFDKNQKEGLTFCQRYESKQDEDVITPIGNAAFIGTETNFMFLSADNKAKKPWWKF